VRQIVSEVLGAHRVGQVNFKGSEVTVGDVLDRIEKLIGAGSAGRLAMAAHTSWRATWAWRLEGQRIFLVRPTRRCIRPSLSSQFKDAGAVFEWPYVLLDSLRSATAHT
jgi:hypothetical protein